MSADGDAARERRRLRRTLEGGKDLELQTCDGDTLPARQFAERHRGLLSQYEQAVIDACLDYLPADVPSDLASPLCLGSPGERPAAEGMRILRDGVRSGYLPHAGVQLKGCRPLPGVTFPTLDLDP